MAQRTVIQLTDDLDGKPIAEGEGETLRFGLDRQEYEIDLRDKNASDLRKQFTKYVEHARKVDGGTSGRGRSRRAAVPSDTGERSYNPKEVRAWAVEHDIEVPARGRIPSTVVVQFQEAGGR